MSGYGISWWGVPGRTNYNIVTHAVKRGKPACGSVMHPDAIEQWCSRAAGHLQPECSKCQAILRKETEIERPKPQPLTFVIQGL
jgi:hypothetical protein